jgi:hypothetical protein
VRQEDLPRTLIRLQFVFFVSSGILESIRRRKKAQKAQKEKILCVPFAPFCGLPSFSV